MTTDELYTVIQYDDESDIVNRWEFLTKTDADELHAMLRRGTSSGNYAYEIAPQPRDTRRQALQLLVRMIHLPDPLNIGFSDKHTTHLTIQLSGHEDFDAYAAEFAADAWMNRKRHGSTIQSRGTADWRGWYVTLSAITDAPEAAALPANHPDLDHEVPPASVLAADEPDHSLCLPERCDNRTTDIEHCPGRCIEIGPSASAAPVEVDSDLIADVIATTTADDHCAPYQTPGSDRWSIGGGPCVVPASSGHTSPAAAIAWHNIRLAERSAEIDTTRISGEVTR